MKALYIDCCIRGEESRSARLAQAFLENLSPEYEVTRRCLMEEALYPLTAETLRQRDALLAQGKTDHPRFRFAHEIAEADLVVMAAPFWDLSFPALLKVYIENVSVEGITFRSTETGLQGLCRGRHLVFLTTRGGIYEPGSDWEQGAPYLAAIQKFFGFGDFRCVAADGLDIQGYDGEGRPPEGYGGGQDPGQEPLSLSPTGDSTPDCPSPPPEGPLLCTPTTAGSSGVDGPIGDDLCRDTPIPCGRAGNASLCAAGLGVC